MKCYVNLNGFRKTETGKRKVWTTDGEPTYCCELRPSYFVHEKNTKHNGYNGYSGYVHCSNVTLLPKSRG